MGVPIKDFLTNRRNRALGSILGHAERNIFPRLKDKGLEEEFRTLIRDAINSYHDSVLDLVKAEDGTRNDVVVEIFDRIDLLSRQRVPVQTDVGIESMSPETDRRVVEDAAAHG